MAEFTQLINRESQLQAILDGYEFAIKKPNWLAEAFQKDGIQNAWDAKKKGESWECRITYYPSKSSSVPLVVLEDKGSKGLTGRIPKNKSELVEILQSEKPWERVGYFLSSDWSKKEGGSLGSRGRGKMIFVGSSEKSTIYFDSLRSDDGKYVFGCTYLDENKEIQVGIYEEDEARRIKYEKLGDSLPDLEVSGTRIIVPHPKADLIAPIQNGDMEDYIKQTWWEILSRNKAKIYVGEEGDMKLVAKPEWLPFDQMEIETKRVYTDIQVEGQLLIEKIAFCYFPNKEIPESYKGISVQRGGMKVEKREIVSINPELYGFQIYGYVEFEESLDNEMVKLESPEHYSFNWGKGIANKVNKIIKSKLNDFVKEFGLVKSTTYTSKQQREIEIQTQKDLNKIASKLGLTGISLLKKRRGKKKPPSPTEPIRISFPYFETPYETGRVDINQSVEGGCVVPESNYDKPLKVLVKLWVYRDGGIEIPGLRVEKEVVISNTQNEIKIGWESINIDNRFTKGKYIMKSVMVSLEEKILDENFRINKADIIYHEISKTFWVEEDPPEKGFFDIKRNDQDAKDKYIWWEQDSEICYLFYNGKHTALKHLIDQPEIFKDILMREGLLVLWGIFMTETLSEEQGSGAFKKEVLELENQSLETQLRWLLSKRSESLWG